MKIESEDTQFLGRVWFRNLPEHPPSTFKGVAVEDVTNGRVFVGSGVVVTITNFSGGANGNVIKILGDGTTTVSNNANIKTNTGANKLLAANKIYTFTYFDSTKLWVEDA